MEGDLVFRLADLHVEIISIHSLRMEGDWRNIEGKPDLSNFNPLPPHGGRQRTCGVSWSPARFQSTPSAWRETWNAFCAACEADISIHSLRMEGDIVRKALSARKTNFNPLPPHGGRHIGHRQIDTHSRYFNPLPPHGGRPRDS